jgi:hypothetical protein
MLGYLWVTHAFPIDVSTADTKGGREGISARRLLDPELTLRRNVALVAKLGDAVRGVPATEDDVWASPSQ